METTKSLNRIKTSELLRTKGAVTGNFGHAKCKAGSPLRDLGASDRESIGSLPTQDEYIRRLQTALGKNPEPKVREFILSELRKYQLRSIQNDRRVHNPQGPYSDIRNRKRFASR